MGVSFVTGKLGAGKGKFAVMKLREAAVLEGRRIAGNVDLYLEHLAAKKAKVRYVRVPDKPTLRDLEALGHGNPESYDEDRNGLLVLDELGTWLNSRSFQDKERAGVLDWLIHARKHGWDVLMICQNEVQIDKQAREALGETFVRCAAMHKIKIPIIGAILELVSRKLSRLPRFHIASVRFGSGASSFVTERIMYRGDHLHSMYDTRQIFVANPEDVTFTQLSPYFFTGVPAKNLPFYKRWLIAKPQAKKRFQPVPRSKRYAPIFDCLDPTERWKALQRLSKRGLDPATAPASLIVRLASNP